MKTTTLKHVITLIVVSTLMGAIIAGMYLVFEWIVNDGSNFLWNDLLQSDIYRWRVVPIAIVMSIILSFVVRMLNEKRVIPPETDLAAEITESLKPTTLKQILVILTIGALSLLAGASLGPEASLVAGSMALAAWISTKFNLLDKPAAKLLLVTSLGALLSAFFCSLIPMAIPLLLLFKKKQLTAISASVVIVASVVCWSIVSFIKGTGYGEVPLPETYDVGDILVALLLGFLSVIIGVLLKKLIQVFSARAIDFDRKISWIVTALVFGTILGILYLIGGQSVQFSGSEGVHLLMENKASYTAAALLGLVAVKLLVTGWSLSAGYRGGLVFPSVYMGVALSMGISSVLSLSGVNEAGATIGAVSGIFITMTSPMLGIVLLMALFPLNLILVVVAGIAGALLGNKVFSRFMPTPSK